ncbi:probable chitinase 10 [Rhagoletis pomonella]|uniref:probable chitinase 10 n=1 Tax=Rhagoletis pomonella TaxID=28610 RepID=UPI00177E35B3|nr:probable chitinase 10 [Rhagoletis pomonella]
MRDDNKMRGESSEVAYIYLVLATITQYPYTSSSHLLYRNGFKRQNGICLNHTSGEFDRNPDDCRSFYLCLDNGQAVMAPCPPTMLFNSASKLCDTADNVSCDIGIPSSDNDSNANDNNNNGNAENNAESNGDNEELNASRYCASQPAEQNRIIFLGSSSSCQQYYICYYGQAVLQDCSANLHWNANTAKCDLPENAGCPLWTGSTGISTIGLANGSGVNGNGADSFAPNGNQIGGQTVNSELINCPIYGQHVFPHMVNCEYFIYCVKGHAMLQKCPFYYHFDIVSKSCKLRTVAICVRDLNFNFRKSTA